MSFAEFLQNTTIEERVTILEAQVIVLDDEVTDLEVNLMELEGDVNFLFDETVIQDERIFTLEQTTDAINAELNLIDDEFVTIDYELESEFCTNNITGTKEIITAGIVYNDEIISDLQTSIFSLDFRVTVLEENGGDDGNSSVAEPEVRVETLEGTSTDHETRIQNLI